MQGPGKTAQRLLKPYPIHSSATHRLLYAPACRGFLEKGSVLCFRPPLLRLASSSAEAALPACNAPPGLFSLPCSPQCRSEQVLSTVLVSE